MDSPITRAEHEEFVRRIDAEDRRQNHRLDELEKSVGDFGRIATSVEKLALNMENMVKEQERQGERLDKLESRPADNWNTVVRSILTGLGSALAGAVLAALAMGFLK